MTTISRGHLVRKRPVATRIDFLGTLGVPARKRWLQPFVVRVFRVRRSELGTVR
jgi:hypothetical protein